jgi:hypothetical protein
VWVKLGSAELAAGRGDPVTRPWPLHGRSAEIAACRGEAPLHGRSKWVPVILCMVAALTFLPNIGTGMVNGAKIAGDYSGIAAQVRAGLTAEQIARGEPFSSSHQASQADRAVRAIPLLRAARVGIFAGN